MFHFYFDQPTPIFKARVNMASAEYPVTSLVFDGVTLGAFGDIIPDMTLFLGSSDGAWDLGIVRVHNVADADEIPVGRVSRGKEPGSLNIVDNAFITVFDDYRVWSKIPRMIIDPDDEDTEITTFKDANIPVLSYTDEIPPVANSGPFFADYIDPDTEVITVEFPMAGVDISYAVAEGATITDYLWDIEDGTLTGGALTDATIEATFPAGKRWVGLTVTDSNGKVHTSRSFVLAVDEDNDVTYKDWKRASFSMQKEGSELSVELKSNLPRNTYPPGSLVLCWEGSPVSSSDRSHMRFIGWQEREQWAVIGTRRGMNRNTTINAVDVAGKMKVLPGFPQALERSEEVFWESMPSPTMNRVLDYLGRWHTTAWSLADIIPDSDGGLYELLIIKTGADDIFTQMASTAMKMVPSRVLTCNPLGQLTFLLDWMETDIGDRPATAWIIVEDDIANINVNYNPQPKAHSLHTGALLSATDWTMLGGQKTIPTVFAIAPGDAFSQGTNEVVQGEGIALTQEDLNVVTGHRYARINSPYAAFNIEFSDKSLDFWNFAPAYLHRVQVNLDTDYQAQRGLEWENDSEEGMLQSLTVSLDNSGKGVRKSASLTWEMETEGPAATTHIPEEPEDPDFESPTPTPTEPPPLFGGDVEEMAGLGLDGYLYRTFDFQETTPTWERFNLSIPDCYTWVVDPFSPKYLTGLGTVDGWAVNDTGIYRIEDMFGVTPSATLVHTFPVATTAADFHWRSINASFGTYFSPGNNPWIIVVSYYGDTSGHEGTWALRSTDGGQTWSDEVQLSADYSTGDTRFSPIGVYASPKTPGLGYTVARGENLTDGLPHWVFFPDGGSLNDDGPGSTYHLVITREPPPSGLESGTDDLVLAPPLNTARVKLHGNWTCSSTGTGLDSTAGSFQVQSPGTFVSHTTDLDFDSATGPPWPASTTNGNFEAEFTLDNPPTQAWPGTIPQIGTGVADSSAEYGIRFSCNFVANDTGANGNCSISLFVDFVIDEIELEDGTIYTFGSEPSTPKKTTNWGASWEDDEIFDPGSGLAGTIHFPWPDNSTEQILYHGQFNQELNREFKLFKVVLGDATDISPSDGSRFYGVNRGHFGVRSFDGDKTFLIASVIGNDTSDDPDDDMHAVYISDDEGATWTEVVAPIADSLAPGNRPAFEAAFSGESEQVIFIWGPADYFGFSTDFGATVQDKAGNLGALGHTGFIGIAGGSS